MSFGALFAIFIAAAGATWVAGLVLSKATEILDDRLGLGDAVGGPLWFAHPNAHAQYSDVGRSKSTG